MVKHVFENPPEQQYIFGIDNTKKPTQKKLIQAISNGVGTGLVESIDIPIDYENVHPKKTPIDLNLDWRRFVMLNIKVKPSGIFIPPVADDAGDDEAAAADDGDEGTGFKWHCKSGLQANIQKVKDEFCKERGLKPFKIAVNGKPCSGKSHFAAQLAKHYGVPHVHKEQVMDDIENWNKEKEAEYNTRQSEKIRLAELAEKRRQDAIEAERLEQERLKQAAEEERLARKAALGSDEEEDDDAAAVDDAAKVDDDAAKDADEAGDDAPKADDGAGDGAGDDGAPADDVDPA
jgi:hypothetical protein